MPSIRPTRAMPSLPTSTRRRATNAVSSKPRPMSCCCARPIRSRANGTLLVDVPNRGTKLAPQLFDDSVKPGANDAEKAGDAGIGFLHGQGYTMAWIGWQADIPSKPGQIALAAPVLRGVTGPARDEILFDHMRSPATANAVLADRRSVVAYGHGAHKWDAPRETPAGLAIRRPAPRAIEITRPATGFDAGALYEVTYIARDPAVLGLGFAATRDVVSFLRRNKRCAPIRSPRAAFRPARDRLWRLAIRAIFARFPLSRFQRGSFGRHGVRRIDAACRGQPPHGDQCSLRPARAQSAASAGSGLAGRPVSVHLPDASSIPQRTPRRADAALPPQRDLSAHHPDRQRT